MYTQVGEILNVIKKNLLGSVRVLYPFPRGVIAVYRIGTLGLVPSVINFLHRQLA